MLKMTFNVSLSEANLSEIETLRYFLDMANHENPQNTINNKKGQERLKVAILEGEKNSTVFELAVLHCLSSMSDATYSNLMKGSQKVSRIDRIQEVKGNLTNSPHTGTNSSQTVVAENICVGLANLMAIHINRSRDENLNSIFDFIIASNALRHHYADFLQAHPPTPPVSPPVFSADASLEEYERTFLTTLATTNEAPISLMTTALQGQLDSPASLQWKGVLKRHGLNENGSMLQSIPPVEETDGSRHLDFENESDEDERSDVVKNIEEYYSPETRRERKLKIAEEIMQTALEQFKDTSLQIDLTDAEETLASFFQLEEKQDPLEHIYSRWYDLLHAAAFASKTYSPSSSTRNKTEKSYSYAVTNLQAIRGLTNPTLRHSSYRLDIGQVHQNMVERLDSIAILTKSTAEWEIAYEGREKGSLKARRHFEVMIADVLNVLLLKDTFTIREQWLIVKAVTDYDSKNSESPFYNAMRLLALTEKSTGKPDLLNSQEIKNKAKTLYDNLHEKIHVFLSVKREKLNSDERIFQDDILKLLPKFEPSIDQRSQAQGGSVSSASLTSAGTGTTTSAGRSVWSNYLAQHNKKKNLTLNLNDILSIFTLFSKQDTEAKENVTFLFKAFDKMFELLDEKNVVRTSWPFYSNKNTSDDYSHDNFYEFAAHISSQVFVQYCHYKTEKQNAKCKPVEIKFIMEQIKNLDNQPSLNLAVNLIADVWSKQLIRLWNLKGGFSSQDIREIEGYAACLPSSDNLITVLVRGRENSAFPALIRELQEQVENQKKNSQVLK